MGATLDETRLELAAQRARVRGTTERLETTARHSFDVKAIIGRHPVRVVALGAGAAYFLLGGPHKTVRLLRQVPCGAGRQPHRGPDTLRDERRELVTAGPDHRQHATP